ncbi:MAG: hypothetical protein ACRDGD_01790 [Candidatus Limnocylindria bacterium]
MLERRHLTSLLIAGIASVGLLVSSADLARACSSEQPSFAEAVNGAEAIARVRVEAVSTYGEPARGETYRVLEVLKGDLPDVVQLDSPFTNLCHDTIGYYVPEGTEAVVAFGVRYFHDTIHPFWVETDSLAEPSWGPPGSPMASPRTTT